MQFLKKKIFLDYVNGKPLFTESGEHRGGFGFSNVICTSHGNPKKLHSKTESGAQFEIAKGDYVISNELISGKHILMINRVKKLGRCKTTGNVAAVVETIYLVDFAKHYPGRIFSKKIRGDYPRKFREGLVAAIYRAMPNRPFQHFSR